MPPFTGKMWAMVCIGLMTWIVYLSYRPRYRIKESRGALTSSFTIEHLVGCIYVKYGTRSFGSLDSAKNSLEVDLAVQKKPRIETHYHPVDIK